MQGNPHQGCMGPSSLCQANAQILQRRVAGPDTSSQPLPLNIISSTSNSRSLVWGRKIRIWKLHIFAYVTYHPILLTQRPRYFNSLPLTRPYKLFQEIEMGRDYCYMARFWNFMSFHALVVPTHISKIRPFPGGQKSPGT